MKILLSINSCVKFARNGSNQALRDTWLQGMAKYNRVDYKFFIGDGTPTHDDDIMLSKLGDCPPRFAGVEKVETYIPQVDEVMLPVPDDYRHLPCKVKSSLHWAVNLHYQYIFKCFADTYVDIERLLSSGFEAHDYTGRWYGGYAVGGSGYWVSNKAAKVVADAKVTDWSEDRWVGRDVLQPAGILLHGDQRYGASPQQNPGGPLYPLSSNEQITAHLSESPAIYDKQLMYEAHELRFHGCK